MYLWMVNAMLHHFLNHKLSPNQHGHRAGYGVMTCWTQILQEIIPARYIAEFDFKDFHPSITYEIIEAALRKFGMPDDRIK
jgi:hypothetical protein